LPEVSAEEVSSESNNQIVKCVFTNWSQLRNKNISISAFYHECRVDERASTWGSLQTKKKIVQLPSEIKFIVMTCLAEIQ
jgi:hypothetical protein